MASLFTCKVHPVVLLSIVDSYERRSQKENKAIGTLLGFYDNRVIEVTNSYPVRFSETGGDGVTLSDDHNKNLYAMTRKTGTEVPVGWYSTSDDINEHTVNYHDYYLEFVKLQQEKREHPPVVLLTLDTSCESDRMGLKAYLRTKAGIRTNDQAHCTIFIPIKVEVTMYETESTCLNVLAAGVENPKRLANLFSGVSQIQTTTDQMLKWIAQIRSYVDDVLSGKRQGDSTVGRKLMELVNSVGKMQPQQFEGMISSSIKDYLMVSYLAQLAKTQLVLHEKMLQV